MIHNADTDTCLATAPLHADTFCLRLSGLMLRTTFPAGSDALIFTTRGLHTCFLRLPIDILFVDATHQVCGLRNALPSWRFVLQRRAKFAIELPAGVIRDSGTEVGHHLLWD